MSELQTPVSVKAFVSLIYNPQADIEACVELLTESEFGKSDFVSEPIGFDGTDYYEEEMGADLKRIILSFENLMERERLVDLKIFSTNLERRFTVKDKRSINIDPGYVAPEHLILATGKGYYHRPYLGRGVYADLTLVYQHNCFEPLEWTYPDYNTDKMKTLFLDLRKRYMKQLRRNG